MEYNFKDIEQRWQKYWKEQKTYKVLNSSSKPKYFVLDMFPYPSGAGLHVGHPLGYIATDIFSRFKRLKGYNVLHPMGFDAFGLPAEQYAIQTGNHPEKFTADNLERYRQQLNAIGFNYDWDREVRTNDPAYYKWTQWIFIQLFHSWYDKKTGKATPIAGLVAVFEAQGNKALDAATDMVEIFTAQNWAAMDEKAQQNVLMHYRLAYQSYADVNWCEALGTVLANDEVKDGVSERGGYPVTRKPMRQWFLRITAYADRLLYGLDTIDWPDSLKEQQRNWIGRSEGATLYFELQGHPETLEIFTTRPDTIFGATFMVLAPEHELVNHITTDAQKAEVAKYKSYVQSRSDRERQAKVKKVTGAFTGAYAINPFNNEKIPVWISEYVLMGYGTGAIMAVPSDDDRDNAFATHFNLPVVEVIDKSKYPNSTRHDKEGVMINSGFLNDMEVPDAITLMCKQIEEKGIGKAKVNYRMRDAGFSRQRYWGEPFPIVYKNDIPYTLPESELPVTLPDVQSYKPTGSGESPLASATDWVNHDGGKRETDTMPGYAGSSWYFLRYMDPENPTQFASKEAIEYWQDVDLYVGGSEHAVGHLLYSRFWHKFLHDLGLVPTEEPFKKLVNQGMIQGVSKFLTRINGLQLYLSKRYVDLIKENNLAPVIAAINSYYGYDAISVDGYLDATLISSLKFEEIHSTPHTPSYSITSLSTRHVDVNIVDNDELSIEGFRKWVRNDDAEFILEDGKYICTSEVEKMSKSKFNVVNPDTLMEKYGADTFRLYEMFLGPLEMSKPWITSGIDGVAKFMRKFWKLYYTEDGKLKLTDGEPTKAELKILHKTIKKIEEDIERLSFNTCVSGFMICVNELTELGCNKTVILKDLVVLLASFAPHIAEELWHNALNQTGSVTQADFPQFNPLHLVENSFNYPISINGKVRANIELPLDFTQEQVSTEVLSAEAVKKWLEGKEPKRFIYVAGRIVNIVV